MFASRPRAYLACTFVPSCFSKLVCSFLPPFPSSGKYIPSIAHYILQVESSMSAHQQPPHNSRHCRRSMSKTQREQHSQDSKQQHSGATAAWRRLLHKQQHHQQPSQQQQQACWTPKHAWPQGQPLPPPVNFQLMGVAIGNGLVDPLPQTRALASECAFVSMCALGCSGVLVEATLHEQGGKGCRVVA